MFKQILALAWKDLKIFFKDRGAVIFIFLQSFMFIVVMSYAMAGMYSGDGDQPIQLLVVNQDRGTQAASIIKQIGNMEGFAVETTWDGQALTRESAEKIIIDGKPGMALVFPADFSETLEKATGKTQVVFISDPATPSQVIQPIIGKLNGLLQQATMTSVVPQGIDRMFVQLAPQAPTALRDAFKADAGKTISGGIVSDEPIATIERTTPPGMHVEKSPTSFQQNVPGYTIYGIFWIVSMLASSVLIEKRDGTFRRLLIAPMGRATMLAGKMLPYFIINVLQIAIMLGASWLLFGLTWVRRPQD